MDIRKATIDDAVILAKYRIQQLIDEGIAPPVENVDEKFINYFKSALTDGSLMMWIATEDGNPIANCGLCFFHLPPSFTSTGRAAYVTNVFTVKEYRRKGIATALLKTVIEEAINMDYNFFRLHASSDGRPVYSKLGFVDSTGYMHLVVS